MKKNAKYYISYNIYMQLLGQKQIKKVHLFLVMPLEKYNAITLKLCLVTKFD
jgi:hypothetical protein